MDKTYNHLDHEQKLYQMWEQSGAFKPEINPHGAPYSIIMPPPNANDPLHVGHAMFVSIEDILIRYHRMKGESSLWLPGTDHAGIETQFVFEKKLSKEEKSRFNFDRETLYKMIWDYVQENSGIAVEQMKKLGASTDWNRFTFTLDPKVVNFVYETFFKLHKDNLLYREEKLVNYCTKCGTGYSELEVEHIEETTKLYYLKYGPFTLATTRPETKFGDTAVAVNPNDKRYKKYIDNEIEVEGLNGNFKLKVIADEYVDPKFGTGVVKITPFHDFNDFEVWQRHKDEIPLPKQVIGLDGRLTEVAGKNYQGMKVKLAREQIVKDLEARKLLVDTKDYTHSIGVCYRCKTVIEPLPLPQFFLKVKPLVEKIIHALDKKEVKIYGTGREKILRNWLINLKDWNISRQIVWGMRIPVWYKVDGNEQKIAVNYIDKKGEQFHGTINQLQEGRITNKVGQKVKFSLEEIKEGLQQIIVPIYEESNKVDFIVAFEEPESGRWIQETDTFDTWFSSGQWPVVTLKIREGDFEKFYPTPVMETGYDILPIWVLRMLLLGMYLTNEIPFKDVYLHGLIRDSQGRKMSKSIGNVINPLEMVEKYGADAIRMALVMSSTPGQDKSVGEETIRGMRNFSNKIWNAARFISSMPDSVTENNKDQELLDNLKINVETMTNRLDQLKVGQAAEWIYNWFWHTYCDRYIELSKKGLVSKKVMVEALIVNLKLLHPFMPFVTEAIWQELKTLRQNPDQLLITAPWPTTVS